MCCLFGILDYKHQLSGWQKNHILRKLSVACEKRGTDATGIAYNHNGRLEIYKRPVPAHSFNKKVPNGTKAVMGHTRLTTQGTEKLNWNNHPFRGFCENHTFALAHNGVLHNEKKLRRDFGLPSTSIETDSYVAVQMIEKTGVFNLDAIKLMAENVEGSFCFTLLDREDNIYLVKGNNPLTIYNFEKQGFFIYASTEEILKTGIKKAGFGLHKYEKIKIDTGDIIILKNNGMVIRETFNAKKINDYESIWSAGYFSRPYYCSWGYDYSVSDQEDDYGTYLRCLIDYGSTVGVSEEEIIFLFENGFDEEDIENLLYSPRLMREYITDMVEAECAEV